MEDAMERLIQKLMANKYWDLLRLEAGGNRFIRRYAEFDEEFLKIEFLRLVMMGFYPLSYSILLAFRQIEMLAPNDDVRKKARFFVEVEGGKLAASDWYRGVAHSELYRRMFSSLAPVELAVSEEMLDHYLSALQLEEGGIVRAVVTAAFIEKTGLGVLHLLHDFVCQWQVLTGLHTEKIDLTYLNEHLLHEGDASADQHVCIIDELIREFSPATHLDAGMAMEMHIQHYGTVTDAWLTHIYQRVVIGSYYKSGHIPDHFCTPPILKNN